MIKKIQRRLELIDAMEVLKDFVDEKYHKLLTHSFSDANISESITGPAITKLMGNNNPTPSTSTEVPNANTTVQTVRCAVPNIDFTELEMASGNWSAENILGQGGFGTVYLGLWKNTQVAIKRIELRNSAPIKINQDKLNVELKQSLTELKSLNECRHDNIIQIYGYSSTPNRPHCIIYQLMPCGNLYQKLYENVEPLSWSLRVRIAIDTAKGIQYMHTFKGNRAVVHGDIKPQNILLDENLRAKIGDFGLARESSNRVAQEISRVYGTRYYLPPEYINYRQLSTKVDSYSYGIVLLEIATRKKLFDTARSYTHLKDLVKFHMDTNNLQDIFDFSLGNDETIKQICTNLIQIGLECVEDDPEKRPEMTTVYKKLCNLFVG